MCGSLIFTCSSRSSLGITPFDVGLSTFSKSVTFKIASYCPDARAVSKGQRIGVDMGSLYGGPLKTEEEGSLLLLVCVLPFPWDCSHEVMGPAPLAIMLNTWKSGSVKKGLATSDPDDWPEPT